jgi:hypothetical protein
VNPDSSNVDLIDFGFFAEHFMHCCIDMGKGCPPGVSDGLEIALVRLRGPQAVGRAEAYEVVLRGVPGYRGIDFEVSLPPGAEFRVWEPNPELDMGLNMGPFGDVGGRSVRLATVTREPQYAEEVVVGTIGITPGLTPDMSPLVEYA